MYTTRTINLGCLVAAIVTFAATAAYAQIATGGIYTLEQSDMPNGGGTSSSTFYAVQSNHGHAVACSHSNGNAYGLRCGFWQPIAGPTAATASISGRVVRADGLGIRNVIVTINGGPLTTPRIARTSSFGYFGFDGLEAGNTYVISISSKRYGFANPSQSVSLTDSINDMLFTSSWQN